jgi:hypothetical protein
VCRPLASLAAFLVLLALAPFAAGCGEGGTTSGATVSAYVAAPLCREAQRELSRSGERAGGLELQVVCLPEVEREGRVDLAGAGTGARRAVEDSTTVAFLEAPGAAAKFRRPIVTSADIAFVEASSGAVALRRVRSALEDAGSSSPREAVLEQVG